MQRVFRIGSRGSDLALWQARHVAGLVTYPTEIAIITTSGDRFLSVAPVGSMDKGFFTKEIEDALLADRIDLAIHSLKDLPTTLAPGLAIGAVSAREAVHDLLLVHPDWVDTSRPVPVKIGGRVGATSLRRQSMLRLFGPGLDPVPLRGNVPTRVQKCRRGEYAAVVLASAGVARLKLDLSDVAAFELDPHVWLPAPGQAALAVETRAADEEARAAVAIVEDRDSRECVEIERALLHRFEGGCHEAFGAWATRENGQVVVRLGHEDAKGRWMSVTVSGEAGGDIVDHAFAALRDAMQAGKVTEVGGALWRRLSS